MRLICPNCDAQYEVPDDVIPEDGRDVQCSNCGHTWFQPPAGAEAEPDEDDALFGTPESAEEPQQEPEPPVPAAEPEAPMHEPTAHEPPVRRQLDPDVANVLREEAQHEAQVRAAEREALETQTELGLESGGDQDEAELRARQARERMARMRGKSPDELEDDKDAVAAAAMSAAVAAAGNTRRDMLPDIEEINSTLRSSSEPRTAHGHDAQQLDPAAARSRGGFRRGFWWMILLAALGIAVYVYADKIAEMVPQAAGPLEVYVAYVDQARVWLDAKILQGLEWLDSMSSESAAPQADPASDS